MSADEAKERASRLTHEVLPNLVKNGKFHKLPKGLEIKEIRAVGAEAGSDHWASSTVFAEIHLTDTDKKELVQKLVVKFPPVSKLLRLKMKSHLMYQNEKVIYENIIPKYEAFLKGQSERLNDPEIVQLTKGLYPECYYSEFDERHPEKALVILENLKDYGYRLANQKLNLNIKHVKSALKAIAKFHGIGYALKIAKPDEHEEAVSKIHKTRFNPDVPDEPDFPFMISNSTTRPILRLLENGGEGIPLEHLKKLKAMLENMYELMKESTVDHPFPVLNHGDFCANNFFFRYDKHGDPDHTLLFDFQTPAYTSPVIDLSFFIYLNTDEDFRNQYFKEILQYYHGQLISTIEKILGRPADRPELSYQEFRKDFAKRAIYGYSIYSFFMPVLISIEKEPFDLEEDTRKAQTQTREERRNSILRRGGEEATLALVKVFKEFYNRGFFQHLLERDWTRL